MKQLASFLLSLGIFLLVISPVSAQEITVRVSTTVPTDLGNLLTSTIRLILIIAGLATFIFLIWGGVQWITSGGDKAAVEAAQHRIQAALLGLFIVFATFAIMMIVETFFGLCIVTCPIRIPCLTGNCVKI